MKWFKHYNTASEGQSFELLISEKDFETAFIYWWLLEQISKFEDTETEENRGKVTLNFSYFKRKLGLNFQRTERVLQKIAKTFNLEITINLDKTVEVFSPKWLELQENRGGKREANPKQKNGKKRQEVRGENKDIEVESKNQNSAAPIDRLKYEHSPEKQKYVDVLANFKLDRVFKLKMPEIMDYFQETDALISFIKRLEKSKKVQEHLENEDYHAAKDYVAYCIKKEIGIL
jgi:hypothetical protein